MPLKSLKTTVTAVALTFAAGVSFADSITVKEHLKDLGCQKVIPGEKAFHNSNSSVRLEETAICINHDQEKAVFVGTAAAMHNWVITGYNSAPWLNLSLQDENLNTIWQAGDKLGLVEISARGGYAAVGRRIPYSHAKNTVTFKIQMGAANDAYSGSSGVSIDLDKTLSRLREIAETGGTCSDCPTWQQDLLALAKMYAESQTGVPESEQGAYARKSNSSSKS